MDSGFRQNDKAPEKGSDPFLLFFTYSTTFTLHGFRE
jgi:hypothetical protein